MKPIIRVEGLKKKYQIGSRGSASRTLRETLTSSIRNAWRRPTRNGSVNGSTSTVWALNGVDFEVKPGEILGIIGRNGAGKSTLLKILSRITEPTAGSVELYGRIGSLLEVGTGFHQELTGRENIYLNGAIMGMKRAEIVRKFDEIVAFSEVERFLDTPVKHYSSGMYMKLAFAVAAHLEPEVLIVDEVLAVGDTAFQKKCLGKMSEIGRDGRTVLLVSHNMPSIVHLCHRAILIRNGQVVEEGSVARVVESYLDSSGSAGGEVVWKTPEEAPGTDLVRIHAVRVYQDEGCPTQDMDIGRDIFIEMEYWVLRDGEWVYPALLIRDHLGTHVLSTHHHKGVSLTDDPWAHRPHPVGLYRSTCCIPGQTLNDRPYIIHAVVGKDNVRQVDLEDILTIQVHDTGVMGDGYLGCWTGPVIRPRLAWYTKLLGDPD